MSARLQLPFALPPHVAAHLDRAMGLLAEGRVDRLASALSRRIYGNEPRFLMSTALADDVPLVEPPQGIVVRPFTAADIEGVIDAWPPEFSGRMSEDEVRSLLRGRLGAGEPGLVALRGERVVGAVWCGRWRRSLPSSCSSSGERCFEIVNHFAVPAERGSGVGAALQTRAIHEMRARGYPRACSLQLIERHDVARRNERLGYTRFGTLSDGYRLGRRRPSLMERRPPGGGEPEPSCVIVGGSAYGSGLAIARSLGARGVSCFVALVGGSPAPYEASRFVRSVMPMRSESPERLGSMLLEWTRHLPIDSRTPVIAFSDLACRAVDAVRADLEGHCAPILPREEVLHAMLDKDVACRRAESAGLDVPVGFVARDLDELAERASDIPYPALAKPKGGGAPGLGFKAEVFADRDALLARAASLPALRRAEAAIQVQEYIPGGDDSVLCYLFYRSRDGRVVSSWTGRKLRQSPPGAGIMARGRSERLPEVARLGEKLVSALDYRGLGGVEFKRHGDRYVFMEMSTRLDAFHGLAIASGADLPWAAFSDVALGTPPARQSESLEPVEYMNAQSYAKIAMRPGGRRMLAEDLAGMLSARERAWYVWSPRDPLPWLAAAAVGVRRVLEARQEDLRGMGLEQPE